VPILKPEGGPLSELQLGIRELFRILVPGAYVLVLLYLLAPAAELTIQIRTSNVIQLIAVFFLGLFAYALRVHERWWPYFSSFDRHRAALDRAIEQVLGRRLAADHVHYYKYFLETRGASIKDRVHYFSSFYYMLAELSLLSLLAAVILFCFTLTDGYLFALRSLSTAPRGTATASGLFICAAIVQAVLLIPKPGLRLRASRARRDLLHNGLAYLPTVLAGAAVLTLVLARATYERPLLLWIGLLDPRVWFFTVLSIALARLGAKQWAAIINEQIIFVRDRSADLRELAGV
jgi:hypothetical protein